MTGTRTPSTAIAQPAAPPGRLSFEQFLAWDSEDVRAEWVDGEIVVMSPNSLDHQFLVGFLYRLLMPFVEARQLGTVLLAPVLMRIPTRPSGREPDLLFVATEHADRLHATFVDGPADIAIEIVSPESDERDRVAKFREYETGGVPEYWLIDAARQEAVFYQRGADGRYQPGSVDAAGIYRSVVLPGFALRVDWLWQRPLPSVAEALEQIEAWAGTEPR